MSESRKKEVNMQQDNKAPKRLIHLINGNERGPEMRCVKCELALTRRHHITSNPQTYEAITADHPDLRRCDEEN
jgi:hypothetical protein